MHRDEPEAPICSPNDSTGLEETILNQQIQPPDFRSFLPAQLTNSVVDDAGHIDDANPLVPTQPTYVQESSGKLRYLGHSSTYAFVQQVLSMLQHDAPSNPSPEVMLSSDLAAYKPDYQTLVPLQPPNLSRLPSKGVALHYLQCIKFRTQPLFYLFDETDFHLHLQHFYDDAPAYAQSEPVWYVHYLILMAFGKALDSHEQMDGSTRSPISEYCTRALQLLPDFTYLANYPVEATEVFSCIALYLQSIDHRVAAILYVSVRTYAGRELTLNFRWAWLCEWLTPTGFISTYRKP